MPTTSWRQKEWCNFKTHKITILISLNTENFYALKRYESTDVDRRTWLHVLSAAYGPSSVILMK